MIDLASAARLRAAFELSPTILSVSTLDDGCLGEVNEGFLRITGYAREDVLVVEDTKPVDPDRLQRILTAH